MYAAVVLKYYKPPPRMERINSSEELLSETSEWKYYSKENEEDIIEDEQVMAGWRSVTRGTVNLVFGLN